MSKAFITGDRKFATPYLVLVQTEMLRAAARGQTIMTGNGTGVEEIVRVVAGEVGLEVEVAEFPVNAKGHRDYQAMFKSLSSFTELEVVCIHAAPQTSSMVNAMLASCEDETSRLVGLESLPGIVVVAE